MLRKMFGLAPRAPPKNRPPHFASKVSYSAGAADLRSKQRIKRISWACDWGAAKIRLIRTSAAPAVQNPDFNPLK